MNKRQGT